MNRNSPANALAAVTASGLLVMFLSLQVAVAENKMKSDELLAKHLGALGTPEARAAIRSRAVRADAQASFRMGGAGLISGRGNILSEGRMLRIGMIFDSPNYSGEQLAYDGKDVSVGYIRPGERSPLSDLIYTQNYIIKDGLFGGALSTAWPLLDLPASQARLDYNGIKKLEGKQRHEIQFKPKKGGAFQILLYFDLDTFQHVRTTYRLTRPYLMGSRPGENAGGRDTIHLIIEEFEDFKTVDGLTLPQTYKISYTIEGTNVTSFTRWVMTVTQLAHNQQLDAKYFTLKESR
jgi:hypothetical protein